MSHVFGPVPSRRLGLSLGIDLIPPKTCTFDCLYCQVGRTTCRTINPKSFVGVEQVASEIERKLHEVVPDVITLAGSGEPTLYSEIDKVISSIKEVTKIKIALLTNGSLLWREEILHRVVGVDIIMPTLTSAFDTTFSRIHRPHPELELATVISGLIRLRNVFKGRLYLEVMLLKGLNDTEEELEALKGVIESIGPDKIQLNTVVRPPSDTSAIALDRKRMEDIRVFFGSKAEIVSGLPDALKGKRSSVVDDFLDMVKRRPLRSIDISKALGIPAESVDELIRGLLLKGYIKGQEHSGEIYYLSSEGDGL